MKKELRAALEALAPSAITVAMGDSFARVKPLPKGSDLLVIPGEILFARRHGTGLHYISFVPMGNRNAFTVELGWSTDGAFPPVIQRPNVGVAAAIERRPPYGFVRLAECYSTLGLDWDATPIDALDPASSARFMAFELTRPTPEEARSRMKPLLEDACAKLREHAPRILCRTGRDGVTHY